MHAIVINKHGSTNVLNYCNIKKPNYKKDHVIIKVKYCAINHLDILVRNGLANKKLKFPHVLGADICGIIENGFGKFKNNEKVIVYPIIKNKYNMEIIGGFSKYNGGYAEFVNVPKECVIKKPKYISDIDACSLNVSYLTVWNIFKNLNCKKNENIFVWGANSGIGTATIVIAKAKGMKVLTTVSNNKNLIQAKKCGADIIINRKNDNVLKKIMKYTNGKGVDNIIDHVGKETWSTSINMLKMEGKMVTCGITTGQKATIDISTIYNKRIKIYGIYMGDKSDLLELHNFLRVKKIKPVIDSIFSLDEIILAHKKIEDSKHFGKIVLKIS